MSAKHLRLLSVAALLIFAGAQAHASECEDDNWDSYKVGKARERGLSKETLLNHLEGARQELTQERMDKILGMIDEVYDLDQDEEKKWFLSKQRDCREEKQT